MFLIFAIINSTAHRLKKTNLVYQIRMQQPNTFTEKHMKVYSHQVNVLRFISGLVQIPMNKKGYLLNAGWKADSWKISVSDKSTSIIIHC